MECVIDCSICAVQNETFWRIGGGLSKVINSEHESLLQFSTICRKLHTKIVPLTENMT